MGEMILHCLFKFENLGWDEAHLQPGSFTSLPASFKNVWVEMTMVVLLVLFVFLNCCMCSTRIIIEKKSQNPVKDVVHYDFSNYSWQYFPWTHLFISYGRLKGPLSRLSTISTPVYFPHISATSCLLLKLLLQFSIQPEAFLISNRMPSLCCLIIKAYIQTSSFNFCISQLLLL